MIIFRPLSLASADCLVLARSDCAAFKHPLLFQVNFQNRGDIHDGKANPRNTRPFHTP